MVEQKSYSGYGLTLIPLTKEDLPTILKWRNDERVLKYMMPSTPQNLFTITFWFNSVKKRTDHCAFMIISDDTNEKIGFIEFKNIHPEKGEGGTASFLNPELIGKGVGMRLNFLKEKVYFDLGVSTIIVYLRNVNDRNIHIWERLGAKYIGMKDDFKIYESTRETRYDAIDVISKERGYYDEWRLFRESVMK